MSGTFLVQLQSVSVISPGFSTPSPPDSWSGYDHLANPLTTQDQFAPFLSYPFGQLYYDPPFDIPNRGGDILLSLVTVGTGTLRFFTLGSNIVLDGLHNFSFNGLPAGFIADSAQVETDVFKFGSSAYNLFLQQDPGTEGPGHLVPDSTHIHYTFPYAVVPSMSDIVANGCGIRITSTLADAFPEFDLYQLIITGTYHIESFTFNADASRVQNGTVVTIESGSLDLTKITAMQIQYGVTTISIPSFIVQTPTKLTFALLGLDVDQPGIIAIYGSSTEFSGFMLFGKLLTIYFLNAKGIYQLTPGKTHDTIYDPSGGTVDLAIPNPFIKTGFIGG